MFMAPKPFFFGLVEKDSTVKNASIMSLLVWLIDN